MKGQAMKSKRIIPLILAAALFLSACNTGRQASSGTSSESASSSPAETPRQTEAPASTGTEPVPTDEITPDTGTSPGTTAPAETTETPTDPPQTTAPPATTGKVTKPPKQTTPPPSTAPQEPVPCSSDNEKLAEIMKAAAEKYGAVGLQAAVITGGRVTFTGQYGWAELDRRPMESDSLIRIASLSKTVVGMVAFRLIDDGVLELDTDISEYLGFTVRNPAYPDVPITLRLLLSHRSGIKSSVNGYGYVYSLDALDRLLRESSSYSKGAPGTYYAYSNFGFGMIGAICENVTGKSLSALSREFFFIPMGTDAGFVPSELTADRLAVIYNENHRVTQSVSKQLAVKDAKAPCGAMNLYAGGLTISAEGFARVLTILMNDGCYDGVRYLSSESVKNILTAQCAKQGYAKQCLPVAYYPGMYGQDGLYFHTGNRFGVFSVYTFDPVTGVGTVVVSTGAKPVVTGHVAAVCGEVSEYVHNHPEEFAGQTLDS